MFNKIYERQYKEYIMKGYNFSGSVYDAINSFLESNIEFSTIEATDKGDVGMKYFGGEYSYDEFMQIYNKIKFDIDTLSMNLKSGIGSIELDTSSKNIILLTRDSHLDLNDMLTKKKTL